MMMMMMMMMMCGCPLVTEPDSTVESYEAKSKVAPTDIKVRMGVQYSPLMSN